MKKSIKIIASSLLLTLFGVFSLKVIEEHDYIEKIPTKYLLNGDLANEYRDSNESVDQNFDYYLISGNSNTEYNNKYAVSLKENVDRGSYTIPSTYNSQDVIGIYRSGFAKKTKISVTIPTSIKVIDYEAFFCTTFSNTVLDIPYTVEKMGTAAFFKTNITSLAFLDTNNPSSLGVCSTEDTDTDTNGTSTSSQLTEIPDFCFAKCSDLESITFSNSLTTIKEEAFEYCSSLSTVAFLGGLKNIGERAFNACRDLSKVYLPSSLFSKMNDAFDGSIGDFAFANCDSDLKFQASTSKDTYASFKTAYASFDRKSDFSSETYEYEFTSGDVYANGTWLYELTDSGINILKYIGNLSSDGIMAFPDKIYADGQSHNVTTIEADCISDYASQIKRVYFPKYLTEIPDDFFTDSYKFITYIGCMSGNNCYNHSTETYTIDLSGMDDLTTIGESSFNLNNKDEFTTLKLPKGLTEVKQNAFAGLKCVNLFSVEHRDTSEPLTIGKQAFQNLGSKINARATSDIELPKGTTCIGEKAFDGALCIRSLTIKGNPNEASGDAQELQIQGNAFRNCKNLQKVIIEDRKVSTGYKNVTLFEKCFSLKDLDYSAYPLLQTVYLPNGVKANDSKTNLFNGQYRAVIYYGGTSKLDLSESLVFNEKEKVNNFELDYLYVNKVAATKFNFSCEIPSYTGVTLSDYAVATSSSILYDNGDFSYLLNPSDSAASVTKYHFDATDKRTYTNNKKTVSVPEKVSFKNTNYTIDEIGKYAFAHSDSYTKNKDAVSNVYTISSVTLPSSIKKIGDYAFFRCVGLEGTIDMPSSLQSIGYLAFAFTGISNIASLNSNCSFTENGSSIQTDYSKPSPFLNCPNLSSITLSNASSSVLKLSENSNSLLDSGNNVWVVFPGYTGTKKDFSFSSTTSKFHFGAFKTVGWIEELTISGSNYSTNSNNSVIAQTLFTGYCSQNTIRLNLLMGTLVENLVNNASPLETNFNSSMVLKLKLDEQGNLTIPDGAFMKSNIKTIRIPYGKGNGVIPRNFLTGITVPTTGLVLQVETNEAGTDWTNKEEKTGVLDFGGATANDTYYTGYKTINEQAFYNCSFLTEVNLGSIETVGKMAFYQASENATLTKVSFGNVKTIGESSFENNTGLTDVNCPNATIINDSAFKNCKSLSNLTITKLVTLGNSAFENCSSLKKVVLPSSLLTIGSKAFYHSGLDSSQNDDSTFIIPSSVTSLGDHAFWLCSSLKKVKFGDDSTIETIPISCFDGTGLTDIILPRNLKTIEHTAFWSCPFTSFEIPDTVKTIAYEAFSQCKNLQSITIPASVVDIGDTDENSDHGAFNSCTSLQTVIIESSNQRLNIGSYAFKNCSALKTLTIKKSNYVLDFHEGCFQNTGFETLTLSNRTMSMASSVFTGCNQLKTLTFGDADIKMWGSDFQGLTNLTTINFESSSIPLYIGKACFEGCTSLTSLDFSNRPVWIGQINDLNNNISPNQWNVFQNCTSLTQLKFGSFTDNYNYIGPRAFALCKLNNVTWGNSIKYIQQYAFDSTKLVTVDLSSCTQLTALNGFSNCTSLKSVLYPTSITSIGESCFSGSTSLTTVSSSSGNTNGVYLSSSIASIGNSAFTNCSAITIVKSEYTGALSLGSSVFSGCTSLTLFSQDTSGSLTYGDNIFSSDNNLKYIVLPSGFDTNSSKQLVNGLTNFSQAKNGDAFICFSKGKDSFTIKSSNPPKWVCIVSDGSLIVQMAFYSESSTATSYNLWEWNADKTSIVITQMSSTNSSSSSLNNSSPFLFKRKEERLFF